MNFQLDRRAFAYYNVNTADWFVEGGLYTVQIGSSSRDIHLRATLTVPGDVGTAPDLRGRAPAYYDISEGIRVPPEQFEALYGRPVKPWHPTRPFTRNTTLGELKGTPLGEQMLEQAATWRRAAFGTEELSEMMSSMMLDLPLRQVGLMDPVHFSSDTLDELLAQLNAQT